MKWSFNTLLWHSFFWVIYVLLEYLADFPHLEGAEHWQQIRAVLLALPVVMVPTYLVVLFAVPKLIEKKNWIPFILLVVVLLAAVFYGRLKWFSLVNYLNHDHFFDMPPSKIIKNVIRDYSVIALAISIYIIGDWRRREKENKRLSEEKARFELELLKRQLHPHFLFNTLNNIYSLALKKSDQVDQSILRLSDLLEYLVYQSGEDKVPLIQEVELVTNYIELERLRYGDDLKVELDIDDIDDQLKMPPLILLPFIENCFKHGGKNVGGVFWIKCNVRIYERILKIHCSNSVSKRQENNEKGGTGLANISQRLDLLYPSRYKLVTESSKEFYSVDLELELSK